MLLNIVSITSSGIQFVDVRDLARGASCDPPLIINVKDLAALGSQSGMFPQGELRGHAFHYSTYQPDAKLLRPARIRTQGHPRQKPGEPIYQCGRLTASYMHCYFASNPSVVASLIRF